MTETKICKKCGTEQPMSEYKKYTAGKGGIKNICRKCENERRRDWKRKNADRINEGRRERTANDPEYRDRINGNRNQWRIDNRERHLKTEREGANRRYRENPEFREKCIQRSSHFYQNRSDEQIQKDWERNQIRNSTPETKERKSKWSTELYKKNRQLCIEMLGGQCVICGTTDNLEFDHHNPLHKSLNISNHLVKTDALDVKELIEELDKCQLLCKSCHHKKTNTVDRPVINQKLRNTWNDKKQKMNG